MDGNKKRSGRYILISNKANDKFSYSKATNTQGFKRIFLVLILSSKKKRTTL
jgi:hypothetical protein